MRTHFQSVFVLGLAALITVPALAQKPGERAPDAQIPAVRPISVRPMYGIVGGLLMTKSVQEELKFTREQVNDVSDAVPKVRDKNKDEMQNLVLLGQPEPKWSELLAKWDDEDRKAVAGILKPEQTKRFEQILRQMSGVGALLNEEVAKELKLTDDQKGKIKGITTEYLKDCATLAKEAGGPFDTEKMEAYEKALQKLNKAVPDNIDKVLTADQRKVWKELTGAPFDLEPARKP